jgi:hypothetical protein
MKPVAIAISIRTTVGSTANIFGANWAGSPISIPGQNGVIQVCFQKQPGMTPFPGVVPQASRFAVGSDARYGRSFLAEQGVVSAISLPHSSYVSDLGLY